MTASSPISKRPLGHGFQLVTLASGDPYSFRLDAPFEPPGWTVRRPERGGRAAFPGSALAIDGQWYEALVLEVSAGSPQRFSYFLVPWEECFPLRQVCALTTQHLASLAAAEQEKNRRIREAGGLRWIPFLLGLLPAEDQEMLERNYGLSANRNTLLTALLLLAGSAFVVMLAFAQAQGMSFGGWTSWVKKVVAWSPLAAYWLVESIVRWVYAMNSREAIGSLPVALPVLTARALVNAFTAEARRRGAVAREFAASPREMSSARDAVQRLPDGRLEVLSRLPKKHWTQNVSGIEFRGEVYFLEDREVVETPDGVRHRFVLAPPEQEVLWKEMLDYRPEEVRDIYREERRLQVAMWVESFAFLWGFLDQETQVRIEKSYNYEPWTKTRWSLILGVVVSLWWLLDSLAALQGNEPGLVHGLVLGAAMYMLWESWVRYRHLTQGEILGSVVGWFLRPLLLPSLKWGPKPVSTSDRLVFAPQGKSSDGGR